MLRIMIMFSLVMCSGWLPAAENLPRKEVYKRVAPSTLLVRVGDSFGSAFIVDRDRRLAITNQHVTDFQGVVEVVFPEIRAGKVVTEADHYRAVKTHRAEVVDVDAARDLALLRIIDPLPETAIGLRFATELPDPGEKVISVGNPGASNGGIALLHCLDELFRFIMPPPHDDGFVAWQFHIGHFIPGQ